LLWLAGEPLWSWGGRDEPKPIEWTWVDLLEFLADSWVRLITEESYPFRLTPTFPTELRAAADRRWDSLPPQRRLEEDEILFRFKCHHDLARGMRGIDLPSLFLMREGEVMWVCSDDRPLRVPFHEVIGLLSECGNFLAEHVKGSVSPHAREVWTRWETRLEVSQAQILSYRLGMTTTTRNTLEADLRRHATVDLASGPLWELPPNDEFADTELLAAARMASGHAGDLDLHAMILARIRDLPPGNTPELDALAGEVSALVDLTKEPYAQGYDAARWLRAKLAAPAGRVDPRELLAQWRVQLPDFEISLRRLDAVACWGPRHGPAVLLNQLGAHAQTERGARATLAHEIGHLLLDRDGSLPLAEVLGGNVPEMPEKRARAFAAEFLLPQIVVVQTVRGLEIAEAVRLLRDEYCVSYQIVGWQITNCMAWVGLNEQDRNYVEELRTAATRAPCEVDD
jgi:Zn-dependent peptidase ImmA (M78 family)